MKKYLLMALALMAGVALYGQDGSGKCSGERRPWSVSISGGPMLNVYENAFSYRDNGRTADLFTLQYGLGIGYDVNSSFSVRLNVMAGKDAGACNVKQTSARGFYPYGFRDVSVFADAILDLMGLKESESPFRTKLYAGLGGAHSYDFTDSGHPWQDVNSPNTVFGFRGGVILEYDFCRSFGIFADFRGDAFTDMFNGLMPTHTDQTEHQGYAGFPLDLRANALLGVTFKF